MTDKVLDHASNLMADLNEGKPGSFITTKAVFAVEYLDEDGERWLRYVGSSDVRNWEIRGMMSEILSDMDAYEVRYVLEEDR